MKVFRSTGEIPREFAPSAVTIGNFDGVHLGHREIMRRVMAVARERGLVPTVLTFDPHPARVLAPARSPRLIMTIEQRLRALQSEGIEAVFLLPFSLDFAQQSPEQFAGEVLRDSLHARVVLVGEDFRFGYKQTGTIETLRALGSAMNFETAPISAICKRGARISSSTIRSLIEAGNVSRACRVLSRPFALEGNVVPGHGVGSRQTVPTLNIAPANEVLPGRGVYVTRTADLDSGQNWQSITNIGYRPTFGGDSLTVETFLLEPLPAGSAPRRLEIRFYRFVRPEMRFETAEALKAQILKDVKVAGRLHLRLIRLAVG